MQNFDKQLKDGLNTEILEPVGPKGSGRVSIGQCYMTDQGKVFVKCSRKRASRILYKGEVECLNALAKTNIIRVPMPIMWVKRPKREGGGAALAMEYIKFQSLYTYTAELGEKLALLHLHNGTLKKKKDSQKVGSESEINEESYVSQFGFPCRTFCSYIAQDNTWEDDWLTFFARRKIQAQMDILQYKFSETEAPELWSEILPKLPYFFRDVDVSTPSLLHGDLWFGNVGETEDGPILFDPACFYGHSEYDLALCKMYGGFSSAFMSGYRRLISPEKGFETRIELYRLFHYLNNWSHFGPASRSLAIYNLKAFATKCKNLILY